MNGTKVAAMVMSFVVGALVAVVMHQSKSEPPKHQFERVAEAGPDLVLLDKTTGALCETGSKDQGLENLSYHTQDNRYPPTPPNWVSVSACNNGVVLVGQQ